MVFALFVAILLNLARFFVTGSLEGLIVDGAFSRIEDFPYMVFVRVECEADGNVTHFICGGSIVNQWIVLTAAHCLHGCDGTTHVSAHVGSAHRSTGLIQNISKYLIHPNYEPHLIDNDIALMKLASALVFGKTVQRISLMPQPPYFEPALVAGWGITDEVNKKHNKLLFHTPQTVWTRESCLKVLPRVPKGAFCAGSKSGHSFASFGDSGSALVVRKYIQIGLVSFKSTKISQSLVVYTDVGYYYDWIRMQSRNLYCG